MNDLHRLLVQVGQPRNCLHQNIYGQILRHHPLSVEFHELLQVMELGTLEIQFGFFKFWII